MEVNVQGVAVMMKMLRAPLLKGPPPHQMQGYRKGGACGMAAGMAARWLCGKSYLLFGAQVPTSP